MREWWSSTHECGLRSPCYNWRCLISDIRSAIETIPKSELHLHLRGAMPIEVFTDLVNKYAKVDVFNDAPERHIERFNRYDNIQPFLARRRWSVDEVSELFRYGSFEQFLATYGFTSYFIREIEDFRELVRSVLRSLKEQNIVYAEIMVTVVEYLRRGMALDDLVAVLDEVSTGSEVRVQWIADLVRDTGRDATLALLADIVELQCKSIVGITLGGNERRFPPAQFSEVYAAARDNGMRLTVHAGEALGPESVWDAITVLHTERVGHGVRAVEDDSLVEHLAQNQVPLEICPTSNLRTGIYPSYDAHPVRKLFDSGVPVAISSDDPTFFSTTLADELLHVGDMGVDQNGLYEIIKNGFTHSFLPEEQVQKYLEDLDVAWRTHFPTVI